MANPPHLAQKTRTALWLLLWLGMVGLGYWIVTSVFGLPAPRLVEAEIGVRGPVVLDFVTPVDEASFLPRAEFLPAVEGSWQVEGFRAVFRPETALDPGQNVRLRLAAGVSEGTGRRRTRAASEWSLSVRAPQVVYVGETSERPEVWRVNADGSGAVRLTDTGGTVYDFAASPAGDRLAYSAANATGGYDLWTIDREGRNSERVVDCGAKWCVQPYWSPDGRLAYVEKQAGESAGWDTARIWVLDLQNGQRQPLFTDENMAGYLPSWSPDGRRIAYYDSAVLGVRVLDFFSGENLLLPTEHESSGAWTPDGKRLIFLDTDHTAFRPLTLIYEVDFATGAIERMLAEADDRYEYLLPQVSPDGERLVLGTQPEEGQPGIQLWSIDPDGTGVHPITDDVTFTHAHYRWSPAGGEVVYQRFRLGSSNSTPEVWLWREETGEALRLAEDASHPGWLP